MLSKHKCYSQEADDVHLINIEISVTLYFAISIHVFKNCMIMNVCFYVQCHNLIFRSDEAENILIFAEHEPK